MTIHFFPKGTRDVPSSRLRAYFIANELKKLQVSVIYHSPPTPYKFTKISLRRLQEFLKHIIFLIHLSKDDIIFSQRTIYQVEFALLLVLCRRILGQKLVFDIDDAVFVHTPKLTNLMIKAANVVIAGGDVVETYCRRFNHHTYFIPTAIPLKEYPVKKSYTATVPLIGWIGDGPSHYDNLKVIPRILDALRRQKIKFRFRLIGALGQERIHNLFHPDLHSEIQIIDSLKWEKSGEIGRHIRSFDIGLAPLASKDTFNLAKNFKVFEYMACGVPFVTSDFGDIAEMVTHEKAGFVVNTPKSWVEAIIQLCQNQSLRQELGQIGRKFVEKEYSTAACASKLKKILIKENMLPASSRLYSEIKPVKGGKK